MDKNPYVYDRPLHPVNNKLICISRQYQIDKMIVRIQQGVYWVIIGPEKSGKTTFLKKLEQSFPIALYVYFDFKKNHPEEKVLYQMLTDAIMDKVPGDAEYKGDFSLDLEEDNPPLEFFKFLRKYRIKNNSKRIILIFDAIENLPYSRDFLLLWRKVFSERYSYKDLKKYTVIISGSADLVGLSVGPGSPFNIAELYYIKDLSNVESQQLIDEPFKQLNIEITPNARAKLISLVSGHPQILQHACHILVENAASLGNQVTEKDIDNAIDILISDNLSLHILEQQVSECPDLKALLVGILEGDKKKFLPYKEFAISGAGPIIEQDTYCAFRNKLYEKLFKAAFSQNSLQPKISEAQEKRKPHQ